MTLFVWSFLMITPKKSMINFCLEGSIPSSLFLTQKLLGFLCLRLPTAKLQRRIRLLHFDNHISVFRSDFSIFLNNLLLWYNSLRHYLTWILRLLALFSFEVIIYSASLKDDCSNGFKLIFFTFSPCLTQILCKI